MNIYTKLNELRLYISTSSIKKSGHNKFANYRYYELGDFIPLVLKKSSELGIVGCINFVNNTATLTLTSIDDKSTVEFSTPIAEANQKGCQPVQNLGSVHTYLRRYLWVNALELVESDGLEAVTGKEPTRNEEIAKQRNQIIKTNGKNTNEKLPPDFAL